MTQEFVNASRRIVERIEKQAINDSVWLPPKINADGTVENILQGVTVNQGPQRGHWAKVNGKRIWIKGQHNYNRQRDPRNPDEAILGTKVMNTNPKVRIESGLEEDGKSRLVDNARIVRLGKMVRKRKYRTYDDLIFAKAAEAAAQISLKFDSARNQIVIARENTGVSSSARAAL